MSKRAELLTIGWREWIAFPEFGIPAVKAKVDTGARSSAIHVEDLELFEQRQVTHVRFRLCPLQRSKEHSRVCVADLHDERYVRSSNGKRELRPVIRALVRWRDLSWNIDLTLTSRDMMGFRMLLGREAMRKRFLVDPGASFLGIDKPPRKKPSAKHLAQE